MMNATQPARPARPARPRGLGVQLRRLSGVQEPVLDLVPGDRARYTSMGGVVLGTAMIAMVSMGVALHAVFGTWTSPVVIAFTVLWGFFILNLDRWLMSTVIDRDGLARVVKFLPRIGLALMFGIIIAEPLLLGVYSSAIERHVRDERDAGLRRFEAELVRCNPVAEGAVRPSDCDAQNPEGFVIPLTVPAKEQDLLQARQQVERLGPEVAADRLRSNQLLDAAHNECIGLDGPGRTGRPGLGPECRKRFQEHDEFKAALEQKETRLLQLEDKVADLTTVVGGERDSIATRVNNEIERRVAERRGSQHIGLLERLRALSELVSHNGYMLASQWALRIFFVVVDSLPVLVKLLTGQTAYDRVMLGRIAREERAAQLIEGTRGYRDAVAAAVHRHGIDLEGTAQRHRATVEASMVNRDTEEELRRLVDERTKQIMGHAAGFQRE